MVYFGIGAGSIAGFRADVASHVAIGVGMVRNARVTCQKRGLRSNRFAPDYGEGTDCQHD